MRPRSHLQIFSPRGRRRKVDLAYETSIRVASPEFVRASVRFGRTLETHSKSFLVEPGAHPRLQVHWNLRRFDIATRTRMAFAGRCDITARQLRTRAHCSASSDVDHLAPTLELHAAVVPRSSQSGLRFDRRYSPRLMRHLGRICMSLFGRSASNDPIRVRFH